MKLKTTKKLMCLHATDLISQLSAFYLCTIYTLTNDPNIFAMVAVELPHTTPAALCHIEFSSCTVDVFINWSTSFTKVGTTN